MTEDPTTGDPVSAALLQLMTQAERMAALDEREAGHYRETAGRLRELAGHAGQMSARLDDATGMLGRQAAFLESLDGLDEQVAAITARLTELGSGDTGEDDGEERGKPYQPIPAPRWWRIMGEERDQAIARLRAWVEQIYAPGYGHLGAALPPCWDQHPLCLYLLDWLSELWSVLYLSPDRGTSALAGQAEWQTRYLPAAVEQILAETATCDHAVATRPRSTTGMTANGVPYSR
jgi:hypothetical protein